jgi:hypothetical protein
MALRIGKANSKFSKDIKCSPPLPDKKITLLRGLIHAKRPFPNRNVVRVQAAGQTYALILIYGRRTDKTGKNTYLRRQPLVPLQCQGIADSRWGLVIDENSMAGCVRNSFRKNPAMALSSQVPL